MTGCPADPREHEELIARVADVECVLFDLDGTLLDTVELIRESMRYTTAAVLGAPLPDDVLMRNVGVPLATQMREFSPEHAEELVTVYREHNLRMHDVMVREYEGVEITLERLAKMDMRLGVVTSKSHAMAVRGLQRFDLERFFDVVIAVEDVERHKPHPLPVLTGADRLGVPPAKCVYVGDSPHDMAAARDAGVIGVAALWGAFEREVLIEPGPPFEIERITDLPTLLSGGAAAFFTRC